jgi:hypothetical protein
MRRAGEREQRDEGNAVDSHWGILLELTHAANKRTPAPFRGYAQRD